VRHIGIAFSLAAFLLCAACGKGSHFPEGAKASKILVVKSTHTMSLLNDSQVLKTYKIAIGRSPIGAKSKRGDHKTPEGNYIIDAQKSRSRFHLALHISYPSPLDRQRAQLSGVDPGGDVEIHGIQNGLGWIGSLHRSVDWTDGCVAVTNDEIDEISRAVAPGTPIEIRP
jgi:murein L,D-transpeptidase YafK